MSQAGSIPNGYGPGPAPVFVISYKGVHSITPLPIPLLFLGGAGHVHLEPKKLSPIAKNSEYNKPAYIEKKPIANIMYRCSTSDATIDNDDDDDDEDNDFIKLLLDDCIMDHIPIIISMNP